MNSPTETGSSEIPAPATDANLADTNLDSNLADPNVDPLDMLSPPATSNSPPATSSNGGWGQVTIANAAQGNIRDDQAALGDTAFVKREKRHTLDAKDLEKLVKNMLTPFADKAKFDKVDMPNLSSISTIQNTATVAELLSKVSSHFTAYDLNLTFLSFPMLDLTDTQNPTWDAVTSINLFESYDDITVERAAITVAWMRKFIISDDEMVRELTWTHHFLLACCSDEDGEGSFARKIRGETDSLMSKDKHKFGGPLTLIIMLKHISSSSEKALRALQVAIPKLNISEVPGEDISVVCNSLGYVLRRLNVNSMPNLSSDLLAVFQTTSHEDFNDVFKTWNNCVLLQREFEPTWNDILDKARVLFDEFSDTWVDDSASGKSIFNADAGIHCHTCGKKGVTKMNCPDCKAKSGATGDETWKKSPWMIFPNATAGDVCTIVGEHKQWTKKIQTTAGVKDVKWCGKCFSKKYNRRGAWREAASGHFTHEHENKPRAAAAANLASTETSQESDTPASPSAVRENVSFSQMLQTATEGSA